MEHSQLIAVAQKLVVLRGLCQLSADGCLYHRRMSFGLAQILATFSSFSESTQFPDTLL